MKTIIVSIFCAGCLGLSVQAQTTLGRQVVAAAGENTAVMEISLSWTVGEAVAGPAVAAGLTLNQGFQQPIIVMTPTREAALRKDLSLRVYPNPTSAALHIDRLSDADGIWNIRIFSSAGRDVTRSPIILPSGTTAIFVDLSELPPGQYFLRVQGENPAQIGAVSFQKM